MITTILTLTIIIIISIIIWTVDRSHSLLPLNVHATFMFNPRLRAFCSDLSESDFNFIQLKSSMQLTSTTFVPHFSWFIEVPRDMKVHVCGGKLACVASFFPSSCN